MAASAAMAVLERRIAALEARAAKLEAALAGPPAPEQCKACGLFSVRLERTTFGSRGDDAGEVWACASCNAREWRGPIAHRAAATDRTEQVRPS